MKMKIFDSFFNNNRLINTFDKIDELYYKFLNSIKHKIVSHDEFNCEAKTRLKWS